MEKSSEMHAIAISDAFLKESGNRDDFDAVWAEIGGPATDDLGVAAIQLAKAFKITPTVAAAMMFSTLLQRLEAD